MKYIPFGKNLILGLSIILIGTTSCLSDTGNEMENNLISYVTCKKNTSPEEFVKTIEAIGGKSLISGNMSQVTDSIFTLPATISIWGYPVSSFSLHQGSNDDGDFNEFAAVIPAPDNLTTSDGVAAMGHVNRIAENYFMNQVGGNDLIVRQYEDSIYISCANDVRTLKKSINRELKQLNERLGGS